MHSELLHIFMINHSKGWGIRSHAHEFYQIWYVTKGEGDILFNGRKIHVSEEDMIFYPAGVEHELLVLKSGVFCFVDMKFQLIDREWRERFAAFQPVERITDTELTRDILRCREYWHANDQFSRELSELIFEEVLLQLFRLHAPQDQEPEISIPFQNHTKPSSGLEGDIIRYVDTHFQERISLDAMAQDKIEALQQQVNQLQLQQALAGVVRYPQSTTYTSGGNPFCGCGCGNI